MRRFICDLCKDPIKGKEMVEITSVDRDCRNTGEIQLYLHIMTDESSRYSKHRGGDGCYRMWKDSEQFFGVHGVRKVSKQDILSEAKYL
jgi:hypothetical protein